MLRTLSIIQFRENKNPGKELRRSRWRGKRTERKWCHERQRWSFKEAVTHTFGKKLHLRGRMKNKSQGKNI